MSDRRTYPWPCATASAEGRSRAKIYADRSREAAARLAGAADQHPADGVIRVQELAFFVAEEVRRLTGGRQKPTFTAPDAVPNLPVFAPAR